MATLKQWIANFLLSIPEVSNAVGQKVYSKRVTKGKTEAPYIVYSVDGYDNKLNGFQGEHGYKGQKVVIDIVGPYEIEDDLEALHDIILAKIIGNGDFGWRSGSFGLVYVENWYDEKSDFSIFRTGLLAKSTF